MDRLFASAMSDGMKEYEEAVAPLKRRLFAQLLSPAPAGFSGAAAAPTTAAVPLQVLELGIGTGPNLQFYDSGGGGGSPCVELTGVDPNPFMLPYLRDNAAAAGYGPDAVRWIEGSAEALPLADASFDAVVCTLASAAGAGLLGTVPHREEHCGRRLRSTARKEQRGRGLRRSAARPWPPSACRCCAAWPTCALCWRRPSA